MSYHPNTIFCNFDAAFIKAIFFTTRVILRKFKRTSAL